jgi:hypothetical protein
MVCEEIIQSGNGENYLARAQFPASVSMGLLQKKLI